MQMRTPDPLILNQRPTSALKTLFGFLASQTAHELSREGQVFTMQGLRAEIYFFRLKKRGETRRVPKPSIIHIIVGATVG